MSDFDRPVRAALSADDPTDPAGFDEPSLLEQVFETFRGRSRWLVAIVFVATAAWLVVACVAACQFFHAEQLRPMLAWAGLFLFSVVAIGLLKIWYWMELNKNSIMREIKRLELLLTQCAAQWQRHNGS